MIVRRRDGALLRQIRTLYNVGTIRELTDGQLLERFATDADEVAELAFSALVERHEALVWRVCLAILRDEHDAEDAFQATFLVLVRKARSLWVRDSLGPWLHQVACRTASCLRATVIRRRKHEQRCVQTGVARALAVEAVRDLDREAAVQEAVNSLPEKYRAPVVLCDLEGRTHQEAARFLGWPIGTVKSRQSQGRRLIAARLVRQGVGLVVAGVVVDSLRQTAWAAVPRRLSRTTVDVAMRQTARMATGFGVSVRVLSLTEGVAQAMLWNRLRFVAVAALGIGIASVGATAFVRGSQEPSETDGPPQSKRPANASAKNSVPRETAAAAKEHREPSVLEARLLAQQLATRKARAHYEIARLNRELAEISVEEYQGVTNPRDLDLVEGAVEQAQSDLSRAQDRRDWAARMFDKGYVSQATKNAEELSLKKARFSLEQEQSRKTVLLNFTTGKTIKELEREVAKARADELFKEHVWLQEQARQLELERQVHLKAD